MIIVVLGPTGVGKTKLSISLAKKYNAIIVNADAMQIYKGLDIGTAKIKEEEKEGIAHYLFDICDVSDTFSVYDYQKMARQIILKNKDKNIVFVGGTGLYIKATFYDYKFSIEKYPNDNYDNYSNEELFSLALKKDKNMTIDKNNRQRLVRFLNKEGINESKALPLYDAIYIGLTADREILYDKINKRVDEMVKNGLFEEVESFFKKNINSRALNTAIGYKEIYKYFRGEITKEEAISLIKKNSRHYAKRQFTFFNNQLPVKYFQTNYDNFSETVKEVEKYLDKKM